MKGLRPPLRARVTAVVVIGSLALPAVASAQTVTEFTLPTANSGPNQIVAGPDGALWFTEEFGNKIGRITTAGIITEFPIPTANSDPMGITTGADGALWFTEFGGNKIGRITTAGNLTEVMTVNIDRGPLAIAPGADGTLWFTELIAFKIGRVSRFDSTSSEFPTVGSIGGFPESITAGADGAPWFSMQSAPDDSRIVRLDPTNSNLQAFDLGGTRATFPGGITRGPDGALWFAGPSNSIGRIALDGTFSIEITIPPVASAFGITTGSDGALWFVDSGADLGRIGTSKVLTEFPLPGSIFPSAIVTGPDGALWFTDRNGNKIGRMTVPAATSPLFAATLPASRSIQIGNTASAFATIINTGTAAVNCGIAPVTIVPGSFTFQTTDPSTNALTGTPNTRVPIGAGESQSFVVAFSPSSLPDSAQVPIDVVLGYDCVGDPTNNIPGTDAAATIVGVNTLRLTFDANPVPDVIAIGLTPSNDGFARTGGVGGTGLFATASSNVGVGGMLTARVRLSDTTLPITATVCETNPGNGACLSPPGPTVTATINQGQNQTWSVFLEANGTVASDPARNRAFFEFVDSNGVVRGSTSTAVTTQ